MKRNKTFALILAVVLLLAVSVGGTLAYLSTKTEPVTNRFEPAYVRCVVNDNLTVTNKSNVDAYIRAAVVVNWMDASGNVYGEAPAAPTVNTTDWSVGSDGFYYYKTFVAADETTEHLVTAVSDSTKTVDGIVYKYTVEVVAEAIQAEGMGARDAQDAWSIAMSGS